jgi:hypothetical protein
MMVNSINVQDIIRRSNRNMLLLAIVGIVIVVIGAATAAPYWSQALSGPQVMTADEVINISPDALPKYNVVVTGNHMFGTFYEEYLEEDNGSQRTTAYFGTLRLDGDKFLVIRQATEIDTSVAEYTGDIYMPTSISRDAVNALSSENQDIAPDLMPFILDANPDNTPWIIGAVVIAIAALVALWGLFQFMSRSRNTGNHPIMKALSRYGDADSTLEQINSEVATSEQKQSFPGLSFTRNWLVYAKGTTFEATRFEDVMWIYPQAVRNKYGTNYYTHLWDRHGRLINVQGSEMQVSQMINAVISRAPWAIGGYSEDIKKSWNSSRPSFIATVDNRRQQGQQSAY